MSIDRRTPAGGNDFSSLSRRHFLATQATGLGGMALGWLPGRDGAAAELERPELARPVYDLKPKPPHHEPRARAVISLFMQGGPSQVDLFDPKPALTKLNGQTFPGGFTYNDMMMSTNPTTDTVLASPWKFHKRGNCGMELSELLPHLGEIADEITLIRSMHCPINNHIQAVRALQTGDSAGNNPNRASLGSWVAYALGSECDDLPAFVALTDTPDTP